MTQWKIRNKFLLPCVVEPSPPTMSLAPSSDAMTPAPSSARGAPTPSTTPAAATSMESIELVSATSTAATPLTEEQQKILHFVYDSAKGVCADRLNQDLPAAMKITQLVAEIMKLMESLSFGGKPITGATKKSVAIELGRTMIRDLLHDATLISVLLPLYDTMAEPLLETMIDVSQHVNVAVKNAAAGCCEWLAGCIRK